MHLVINKGLPHDNVAIDIGVACNVLRQQSVSLTLSFYPYFEITPAAVGDSFLWMDTRKEIEFTKVHTNSDFCKKTELCESSI